jgi:O-antigen/teichoic acid export membrane protein
MGWMFFIRLASMLISFLATAMLARKLGPGNYGQLSYALSFTSIFGFIASLGIDQILYRDIIKYPELKNKYMGSAILMKIVAGFIAFSACIIVAFSTSPHDVSLILIAIIALTFIFNSFQIIGYEFQADVKSKYPSLVSFFVILILNILKIAIVFSGKGVIYLAIIVLLEPILYMLGFIYYRKKIYGAIKDWSFDKKIAISLLKDSWPLIFSSAFISVYSRIDQVMIKNMMDAHSVGLYDPAVRISEAWYFIPNIIVASVFPAIMNARKVSEELYHRRFKRLVVFLFATSAVTSLFTIMFSKFLVGIIYGQQFVGAIPILNIYVLSNIATAVIMVVSQYLIAENYRKALFILAFSGAILNVLLNIYMIPKFGTAGAAWATAISYTLSLFSILLFKLPRKGIIEIFKRKLIKL